MANEVTALQDTIYHEGSLLQTMPSDPGGQAGCLAIPASITARENQQPEVRAVADDAETAGDIRSASSGNLAALWRLQKNPLILQLVETREIQALLDRRTLADLAEAVRSAREALARDDDWDR